jgi:hypothetical protein
MLIDHVQYINRALKYGAYLTTLSSSLKGALHLPDPQKTAFHILLA